MATTKVIQALLTEINQHPVLAPRTIKPSDEEYHTRLQTYFSQQEQQLHPASIIVPQSTAEVAELIKCISKHSPTSSGPFFAVKSGGKTPWPGSANIAAGLTIDLSALNAVVPAPDHQTVSIGPGCKWGDVYPVLDAAGLGIVGGRDATVGVAGLTLGGGLSFFSPSRGFVCDNVRSFEVVLANGEVVNASKQENSELWRALKGGSSNFGIVTRFEFECFPLGNIWGGQNVYPITTAAKHLDAIFNFVANPSPDPHATVIQSFALYQGNVIVNEGLKYTQPVENPPVFSEFLAIESNMYSSNKVLNMTAAANEQAGFNTNGRRQALVTTTFINDRSLLQSAFDTWHASVPSVQAITNISWSLTFQPLPHTMTHAAAASGGNVLGLDAAPPLILAQMAVSWDDVAHDDLVDKALGIVDEISAMAEAKGLGSEYRYLNYADVKQDPIKGYGKENGEFLRMVARKVDPKGLWQRGLGGGFKVFPA